MRKRLCYATLVATREQRRKQQKEKARLAAQLKPPQAIPEYGTPSEAPWYESTLLWGALGAVLAIMLIVIGAATKDLRWLLSIAWPFACVSVWAAVKNISSKRKRRAVVAIASALIAVALYQLHIFLGSQSGGTPAQYTGRRVAGEVVVMFPWSICRFYQNTPQYYQALDTELLVSITNRSGHDLYFRGHTVEALVDGTWIKFKNAEDLGLDQFSFGFIDRDYKVIRHFDLSANGFDYVMQQRPLKNDESLDAWMFFKSGLILKGKDVDRRIKQFKVFLYDSAEDEYAFTSTYPTRRSTTIVIPNPDLWRTGQAAPLCSQCLNMGPVEPLPPNLQEEPVPK
jgi:hypothetical protein